MKKKFIIGILMMVALLAISVQGFALTEGDWEFQLLDNEVTITGYIGEGGDVVIPETLYGCPVTKVDSSTFGVKRDEVVSIVFPAHIKEIPKRILWDGYALETVILPEGVESIENEAFEQCANLTEVNFPSTLKKVGMEAFCDTGLLAVSLPEGIEEIGMSAFSHTAITEITVPVAKINSFAFSSCESLKKATILNGTTEIPSSIFSLCKSLEEVDIPPTVTKIGGGAFQYCENLKSIILPTALKEIDGWAFADSGLVELVIPYGTVSVGGTWGNAFDNCQSLRALYIPDTVTVIDGEVINGSDNCIIYCTSDSKAAEVCKENSISYLTDKSVNSGITVLYNGTRISFHKYDQNPELINSRTLVPLRAIFEAMNAEVTWDDATSTAVAVRDGITIKIPIGANEMYKNGSAVPVDVPAQLINDRTMVPVRVIAEAFGADVQWNDAGKTVLINE